MHMHTDGRGREWGVCYSENCLCQSCSIGKCSCSLRHASEAAVGRYQTASSRGVSPEYVGVTQCALANVVQFDAKSSAVNGHNYTQIRQHFMIMILCSSFGTVH